MGWKLTDCAECCRQTDKMGMLTTWSVALFHFVLSFCDVKGVTWVCSIWMASELLKKRPKNGMCACMHCLRMNGWMTKWRDGIINPRGFSRALHLHEQWLCHSRLAWVSFWYINITLLRYTSWALIMTMLLVILFNEALEEVREASNNFNNQLHSKWMRCQNSHLDSHPLLMALALTASQCDIVMQH